MTDIEQLYQAEYEPMVRLARLLTGSVEVAEEAVQEAFMTLHRVSNQQPDRIDNPGGYLRRTVVNNCYSRLRRKGLERRKLSLVDNPSSQPVLPPELDETWRALERLKPKQRTALVLRYYEDMSVRDVADVMNEREGTVKSLIHRGLQRLRTEVTR